MVLGAAGRQHGEVALGEARRRPLVDRIERVHEAIAEGGDPLTSTPEEYAKDIDTEETKWGTLVRKLNLKVE